MNITDLISKQNIWWKTGKMDGSRLYKRIRTEFSEIVKNLYNRKIIYLSGPRSVGKTTLLFQTADYLLNIRVNPSRVLYMNGGEFSFALQKPSIREIIENYAAYVVNKNIDQLTDPIYILIDDVHTFKDWQIYLQYYVEKGYNFKFLVSGPTPVPYLPDDLTFFERIAEIPVYPLTQSQFVEFYCLYKEIDFDLVKYKSVLPEYDIFGNPGKFFEAVSSYLPQLKTFQAGKIRMIQEYLLAGGYPGYFGSDSITSWHKRLADEIVEHSIYRDIVCINSIKSPENLKRLVYLIASMNGTEQSFAALGKMLKIDTVTVMSYLSYLSFNNLIRVSENFSGNTGKIVRKNKRFYTIDCGVKNALSGNTDLLPNDIYQSITNSCLLTVSDYAKKRNIPIGFWRDNKRETDIILQSESRLLPIKIAHDNFIGNREIKDLLYFTNGHKSDSAIFITSDLLKKDGDIYFIPYWLF